MHDNPQPTVRKNDCGEPHVHGVRLTPAGVYEAFQFGYDVLESVIGLVHVGVSRDRENTIVASARQTVNGTPTSRNFPLLDMW